MSSKGFDSGASFEKQASVVRRIRVRYESSSTFDQRKLAFEPYLIGLGPFGLFGNDFRLRVRSETPKYFAAIALAKTSSTGSAFIGRVSLSHERRPC